MESEYHVQQVWEGRLDAARLVRYYGSVANRLRKLHKAFTVFVAIMSTGAAFSFLGGGPDWVSGIASILVATAAAWSSYSDYSQKSLFASNLRMECGDLEREWKRLWSEVGGLCAELAIERALELERRADQITAQVPAQLPTYKKLNEECAREVYELNEVEQPI